MPQLPCFYSRYFNLISKRMVFAFGEAPKETLKVVKEKQDLIADGWKKKENLSEQIKSIEDFINKINDVRGYKKIKIPLTVREFDQMLNNKAPDNPLVWLAKEFTDAVKEIIKNYEQLNAVILKAEGSKDQFRQTLDSTIATINTALGETEKMATVAMNNIFSKGDPLRDDLSLHKISAVDAYRDMNATEQMVAGNGADNKDAGKNLLDKALGRVMPLLRPKEKLSPDKVLPELVKAALASGDDVQDAIRLLGPENAEVLKTVCSDTNRPQTFTVQDADGKDVMVTAIVGKTSSGPAYVKISFKENVGGIATTIGGHEITVVMPGTFISYLDKGHLALDSNKMAQIKEEPLRPNAPEKERGMTLDDGVAKLAQMPVGSKMLALTPDGTMAVGVTISTNAGVPTFSVSALQNSAAIAQFRASEADGAKANRVAVGLPTSSTPDPKLEKGSDTSRSRPGEEKAKTVTKEDTTAASAKIDFSLLDPEPLMRNKLLPNLQKALGTAAVTVELLPVTEGTPEHINGLLRNIKKLSNDNVGYAALASATNIQQTVDLMAGNIGRVGGDTKEVRDILKIGKNTGEVIAYGFKETAEGKQLTCTIGGVEYTALLSGEVGKVAPVLATKKPEVITERVVTAPHTEKPSISTETFDIPEKPEEILAKISELAKGSPTRIKNFLPKIAALLHAIGPNQAARRALGSTDEGKTMKGSPFQIIDGPEHAIDLGYAGIRVPIFAPGEIAAENLKFAKWFGDKKSGIDSQEKIPRLKNLAEFKSVVKEIVDGKRESDLDASLTQLADWIRTEGPNKEIRKELGVDDKGNPVNNGKFQLVYTAKLGISLRYGGVEKIIFAPDSITELRKIYDPENSRYL